ncbi:hypothetical protein DL765_009193 [Monosporascus sp. GIB2]|nr:hypothetical protein DL765_009193 [Monosporascus sp. GIB2]
MRFPTFQLIGLMGVQAVFGRPAPEKKLHNGIDKRAATAFTSGNAILERSIDDELYLNEIVVGDQIDEDVEAKVYKATVPGTEGFDPSKTYALKKDYKHAPSLENEYETYKAIDGQGIGPTFEAIVTDTESLDDTGILIEYIDTRPADPGSKDDARGALAALLKMHDLGYVHGGTFALGTVLVNKSDGKVVLADFVGSEKTNDAKKKEEDLDLLKAAFSGVKFDGDKIAD